MCRAWHTPSCATELIDMPVRRLNFISGRQYVFVTTTVRDWTPVFADGHIADLIVSELTKTVVNAKANLIGYVVMPTHVHLILEIEDYHDLSQLIQSFKSVVARRLKSSLTESQSEPFRGEHGFHLWMRRFDEIILVSEKQFQVKLEYMHNNPVRAGLVTSATDWPWSSAREWLTDVDSSIVKKDRV
jgi:putative transposase